MPWSILQADKESQVAFLAAYAECDGRIRNRGTAWLSVSETLTKQIQAILNSHGYVAIRGEISKARGDNLRGVSLYREDAEIFWSQGSKYLTTKVCRTEGGVYQKTRGVPAKFWLDLVNSRRIKFDRYGAYFLSDNKEIIRWSINENPWFSTKTVPVRFNYEQAKAGKYNNFIEFLQKICPDAAKKLLACFKHKYMYSPIVRIESLGKEHVYDISMKDGIEPAFVANGIVVHNSFGTSETAMQVFLQSCLGLRNRVTHAFFYSRLFPAISHLNGFKEKDAIGTGGKSGDERKLDRLIIPRIRWHKQLAPQADSERMDLLQKLKDAGMPVTMRAQCAAAGENLDDMISDYDNEKEAREKVKAINKALGPEANVEESAVLSSVLGLRRRRSVLGRDFSQGSGDEHEITARGKTGKKKYVHNQRHAQDDANTKIYDALKVLSDPRNVHKIQKMLESEGLRPNTTVPTGGLS